MFKGCDGLKGKGSAERAPPAKMRKSSCRVSARAGHQIYCITQTSDGMTVVELRRSEWIVVLSLISRRRPNLRGHVPFQTKYDV